MAYSPQHSPAHSRHHSTASHGGGGGSSSPLARRTSRSSINTVQTPLRNSFSLSDAGGSVHIIDTSSLGLGGGGNLADELGDAFDDEDFEDGYEYAEGDEYIEGRQQPHHHHPGDGGNMDGHDGVEGVVPDVRLGETAGQANGACTGGRGGDSTRGRTNGHSLGLTGRRGRHRRTCSEYDGSEYGSESDLDCPGLPPGLPPGLIARIDDVESLARRGIEANGGPTDGVFKRVADALRDLGSQSGVEGRASKLITMHSSLTTHLIHETRQLQNLVLPILSPLTPPPTPETIDELLPLLLALPGAMPRPSTTAYSSLAALHALTADLVSTLSYLADSLHMSRQTTTAAMRRLKVAKELVAEMKREDELSELGQEWLERNNWGERLERRECATVCGEVVSGFEEVCDGWRQRLLAQAQVEEAPA